jgi:GTPase
MPGMNRRSYGKKGEDRVFVLPLGTTLTDLDSGKTLELDDLGQEVVICKGGLGGRGNLEFKSATNRSPDYAQPGLPGEVKRFKVDLKFIADYGLIGLPNAGKSSLLNELTAAQAAVGAYPFTTLEAGLGAFGTKIIADIPGLIEGASSGRGLGTKFLKHIEKVKFLLQCITCESKSLMEDYTTVNDELTLFNPLLSGKKRIILLTKSDLVDKKTLGRLVKTVGKLKLPVYPVSVYDLESIEKLKSIL